MSMSRSRHLLPLYLALVLVVCASVSASVVHEKSTPPAGSVITDADVASCAPIAALSALKIEAESEAGSLLRTVFGVLFPFGPGWNSVLGTFYISSVPNLILAFIPAQIAPNTLNTMTAFATGGLLSDVFLHLVPHSFTGESQASGARFILVDEKRNILIGLATFGGFAAFFVMEKTLRVLGAEGHDHSHADGDEHATTTAVEASDASGLRQRKGAKDEHEHAHEHEHEKAKGGPSKLSAYLNLFGDFVHNITDGLAMAASFYSSPLIGATTTLACFAHEIPHEIADYSILVRAGFSKRQAMMSQFGTAVGAFVGTFLGIAIHNISSDPSSEHQHNLVDAILGTAKGYLGTTVLAGDLVIPFVAGGFLYIGAVAVLPSLLEESKSGVQAVREFGAMAVGVGCMFLVAWNE
ncbi:Zip-domain-containing protein [Exidia glandulosa HHB12029]|uniref:Zip-domain-containing protein n=1 Tax=Exidia glandulosa HHB12029 TaxID=1314781 RepID=A0A165KN26_EXIGL|nr:Zip-domain-containing protein [Exidia glandulosa HHB12029]